jgi:hypothetical protein
MKKQWLQPVLTANGTIGVSDFACQSGGGADSSAYKVFDSSNTSYMNYMNPDAWLMFYVKQEIEITEITVQGLDGKGFLPYSGKFQVSTDDGTTWTDVGTWEDTENTRKSADIIFNEGITSVTGHYFRLYSTGRPANGSDNADLTNVIITALAETEIEFTQPVFTATYKNDTPNIVLDTSSDNLNLVVTYEDTNDFFYDVSVTVIAIVETFYDTERIKNNENTSKIGIYSDLKIYLDGK